MSNVEIETHCVAQSKKYFDNIRQTNRLYCLTPHSFKLNNFSIYLPVNVIFKLMKGKALGS